MIDQQAFTNKEVSPKIHLYYESTYTSLIRHLFERLIPNDKFGVIGDLLLRLYFFKLRLYFFKEISLASCNG